MSKRSSYKKNTLHYNTKLAIESKLLAWIILVVGLFRDGNRQMLEEQRSKSGDIAYMLRSKYSVNTCNMY